VPDSPDSACPLHLRPIVVSSPNCSARDRRLCLRCNLAFWAVPAKSRRRLQQAPLVQTLTSRLDPRAQPAPPSATASATADHRPPALASRSPGPAVDTYARRPMYGPIQLHHTSVFLVPFFPQRRLALVASPCQVPSLPTSDHFDQGPLQLSIGFCCTLALSSQDPIPS